MRDSDQLAAGRDMLDMLEDSIENATSPTPGDPLLDKLETSIEQSQPVFETLVYDPFESPTQARVGEAEPWGIPNNPADSWTPPYVQDNKVYGWMGAKPDLTGTIYDPIQNRRADPGHPKAAPYRPRGGGDSSLMKKKQYDVICPKTEKRTTWDTCEKKQCPEYLPKEMIHKCKILKKDAERLSGK